METILARHLVGIDLGTSSVRAGVYREDGVRLGIAARTYPIHTPEPGRAVQDPEDWWRGTCEALREALAAAHVSGSEIAGIAFSSQMHGGVLLDADGTPLGPAIIWADARAADLCPEIEETIGRERLETVLMNHVFPGTFAATLSWVKRHDRGLWDRIRRIMTPSDYIRFRMCGLYNTEPSAASATLLFDIGKRDWSEDVLGALGIPSTWLPYVVHADQHIGETEDMEEATGIPDGIPVAMGGADQPCAALGNGVLDPGTFLASIGTGGQLFAPVTTPQPSPDLALTTFCHLPESRWYVMGATLAGGLCLRWLRERLCPDTPFETLSEEAAATPPGAEGLLFRPYLAGRRSPVLDPGASGSFTGLRLDHTRGHLVRAVMEGVAMELRTNLEVMVEMGLAADTVVLSGGASKSDVWTRIVADVFNRPVAAPGHDEQACFGAALAAGIGVGMYRNWREAATLAPAPVRTVEPGGGAAAVYDDIYGRFCDARGECLGPKNIHN